MKQSFRSPLRYPGGKSWLAPTVAKWVQSLDKKPRFFVEPYAGGASVGLEIAFTRSSSYVILVEKDPLVASFWKEVFYGQLKGLSNKVSDFKFVDEIVLRELEQLGGSSLDQAFRLLLRNRVSRAGLLTPSSGLLKRGENDKGLKSRWYAETLVGRLNDLEKVRGRVHFLEWSAESVIAEYVRRRDSFLFIDPPYTFNSGPGRKLYNHSDVDDEFILKSCSTAKAKSIITYHSDNKIKEMCHANGLRYIEASRVVKRSPVKDELIIAGPAGWSPWPAS